MNKNGDLHEQNFASNKFLSVSSLNRYINYKFENDVHLQEVYLRGEISNFKTSGQHMYFSLKDEFSEISAIVFYHKSLNLSFKPENGMVVQALGTVQVYEKRGSYAIVIKKIAPDGIGLLYQEFLELKEKLQKEGLFDQVHKLPIPAFPVNVAIITAATGDAIHDIISTFNRRLPLAKLILYPALVQGRDAPNDLIRALKSVYQNPNIDVIIISRGGGSFEDLACFNDERLARLLFSSPIPTVSAIGHEADYTICDFVSSLRAPTPTGAAMLLTKEKTDLINQINANEKRLSMVLQKIFNANTENIIYTTKRLENCSPLRLAGQNLSLVENCYQRLNNAVQNIIVNKSISYQHLSDNLRGDLVINIIDYQGEYITNCCKKIEMLFEYRLKQATEWLNNLTEKAIILNPLNLMSKGYAILYQDNMLIDHVNKVDIEKNLQIKLAGGELTAQIVAKAANRED